MLIYKGKTMILSASRRTDIPAFYSDWFFNRLKVGEVLVRNPLNPHQVSTIKLSPEVVDCIVFWTKDPTPMLSHLDELDAYGYKYYFQFTVNPYAQDIEVYVPCKHDVIIPTFKSLSQKIGKHRVIWRYDPIFLTAKYTYEFHLQAFAQFAQQLAGSTDKCVVSFLDVYKHIESNITPCHIQLLTADQEYSLLAEFQKIAQQYGMTIETCAEKNDFATLGIQQSHCIDRELIERICGYKLKQHKTKDVRPYCGCCEAMELGAYNTCLHGCVYCYANWQHSKAMQNLSFHDPNSPLLIGTVHDDDKVTIRKVASLRDTKAPDPELDIFASCGFD